MRTCHFEEYNIFYSEELNQTICRCSYYTGFNEKKKSKKDIFNSIYNLGKEIYQIIKKENLSLEISYNLKIMFDEHNIQDNIFTDLDKILLNKKIKSLILEWFYTNGIPNYMYNKDILNCYEDFEDNEEEKNDFSFILRELKGDEGIITSKNSVFMSAVSSYLRKLSKLDYIIKIKPLINISLFIYFIFCIKNKITSNKISNLETLLKPFPELIEKYNMNFFETSDLKEILKYLKNLIIYLQLYIKENNLVNNITELTVSNDISISKNEKYWNDFNFISTKYISLNPFLTAYEYFLQLVSIKNSEVTNYFCEECNSLLDKKQHLCYQCKLKYYDIYIEKDIKLGKTQKAEKFKKEREELTNNHNIPTPLVENRYQDNKNHKNKYKKNK